MNNSQSFGSFGPTSPPRPGPVQYGQPPPPGGPQSFPGYSQQHQQQPQQYGTYGSPQQQPFMPTSYHPQPQAQQAFAQQPYAQPYVPQQSMPSQAPPPQQQQQQQQQAFAMPAFPGMAPQGGGGGGFMSNLSPLNLMTGGLLSAPQQYMQQRVGWLKTNMTGGTMNALFNISNSYVSSKMLMLLAPFLGRWTYTRMQEQIAGGQKYRPPNADVNAPDLYIPLMAAWAYVLLGGAMAALGKTGFKPDIMSSLVYGACLAWALHWLVVRLLLRGMNVPVPWSELLAYTGYAFVHVCIAVVVGCLAGRTAYWVVWAYGSTCMAMFMVKTMKRVIFQETRQYGQDLKVTNYLLLALALFQYPYAFWLGVRPPK